MESTTHYRNATYVLVASLSDLLTAGEHLVVRGSKIVDLRNHISVLHRPRERCIILPKRNNNIFATIAETAWVMAGRNGLAYLSHYLPRAGDFSDDGLTWRAAYGPRLRQWHGTDQLQEIVRLLCADPSTRRAVMAIFDPAIDTQESKDIPCNNWLDWLTRDNKLHLSIALRSNDAVWGFSGINSFEWSVLQEMLAFWTGVEVGASSPRFNTAWEDFDATLAKWLAIESLLRITPEAANHEIARFPDPLFGQFLSMLQLYSGIKHRWSDQRLAQYLGALPENDLTAAAYEYISRTRPAVIEHTPEHTGIKQWLASFDGKRSMPHGQEH